MCVVEVEGRGIQSSCTMPPENGLKIRLNTEKQEESEKLFLNFFLQTTTKNVLPATEAVIANFKNTPKNTALKISDS